MQFDFAYRKKTGIRKMKKKRNTKR